MFQWVKKFLSGRDVGKNNDKPTKTENQLKFDKAYICRIIEKYVENLNICSHFIERNDSSLNEYITKYTNMTLFYLEIEHPEFLESKEKKDFVLKMVEIYLFNEL